MNEDRFKSLVDTAYSNSYAIFSIAFVVLSAVLFCFNLLAAWDPSVIALPEIYAKAIYGLGGVSGLVVYAGMLLGWLSFRGNLSHSKLALQLEVGGLGAHVVALVTLAASTASAGPSAAWIAPTSFFLAVPHALLFRTQVRELARFGWQQERLAKAVSLVTR